MATTAESIMNAKQLKTKHGNRIFLGAKPKDMSKLRYGIVISYSDMYARPEDRKSKFSFDTDIKELYYQFYDRLFSKYGKPNGFGYIKCKDVLINPVGDLHSRRYFISDKGKKRLEELKLLKKNRIKAAKRKAKLNLK